MNAALDYLAYCGNVYGGGCGTDLWDSDGDGVGDTLNHFAGVVYKNSTILMDGGYVERNIYGGGAMANLGHLRGHITYHTDDNTGFALSWPAEINCRRNTGIANITITDSARVGYTGSDNGDVFGASRGQAGDRYSMARIANVDSTYVVINIPVPDGMTEDSYFAVKPKKKTHVPLVAGSVYGGAENGHVHRSTRVDMQSGVIGHGIYGGGKGKGQYQTVLKHITAGSDGQGHSWTAGQKDSVAWVYSLSAGKVYRNTHVNISGGKVTRNVYGGGNMASVGKGNYSGGPGDYRPAGYGEKWVAVPDDPSDPESPVSMPLFDSLLATGHTYVTVTGGVIGKLDPEDPSGSLKDDLPLGNVFGGCRGEAAPSVSPSLSPRYHYEPAFFSGYVNHAHVIIGDSTTTNGPRLFGSVYGGGQDGHVRVETDVKVYGGEIGVTYINPEAANALVGVPTDEDLRAGRNMIDDVHWVARGNVYGAGSGIGKYKRRNIEDYSSSSGSVTCSTYVYIKGGLIHRSVYGGGALASIGPLVLPNNPVPQPNTTKTVVIVCGGVIGSDVDFDSSSYTYNYPASGPDPSAEGYYPAGSVTFINPSYGSRVYGASRGLQEASPTDFATDWWAFVTVRDNAHIYGSVFGGGELGTVKKDTRVNMLGGEVEGHLYGAGRGIPSDSYKNYCDVENTYVTIQGGQVHGDIYGGGRDGHVTGNTDVLIKGTAEIGDEGTAVLDENDNPTGYWEFSGNVFGGGRGSGDEDETEETLTLYKTCGRVGGNTQVIVEAGTIHGSIFGGGRLALTGVDVNGGITSFLEDNETGIYDSVNHGMATVRVLGGTIGDASDANLLKCDWSVGDVMGSGKGDIDYYDDIFAGRVMNSRVDIVGNATVRGSVFGGGEMAGIGWWDNNGVFVPHTGTSTVHIKDTTINEVTTAPTIGTAAEFTYDMPTHEKLYERTGNENPGLWTMYNYDGTILHTCTGNVYGASQGDVDVTCPHWVSMARSRQATVTIDGGTIRASVYGGAEQGIVTGNTHVIINGGTIGTAGLTIGPDGQSPYALGDVYGAGYGCDDPDEWGIDYGETGYENEPANDSTAYSLAHHIGWNPGLLAGRTFGNATVDILGGTLNGSVYGGGSMASVGDDKPGYTVNGNTYVNIGRDVATTTGEGDEAVTTHAGEGNATIHGDVFGANNYSGTPFGNTYVNIYHTAHTSDNPIVFSQGGTNITIVEGNHFPLGVKGVSEPYDDYNDEDFQNLSDAQQASMSDHSRYAINAVYGGGNKAAHAPLATNGTTNVHVWYCGENTIWQIYGGGNAADTKNNHLEIDGGYFNQIFGGGNGAGEGNPGANVSGTAKTDIHGGLIHQLYGGSNTLGNVATVQLNVDRGGCEQSILESFGGGNEAPGSGGTITIQCGTNFDYFYAGANQADIVGDVTLDVYGGNVNHLFGGSKGNGTTPANIDGDVTVNLYGGNIGNLYGASHVNGNVTGLVTVNVDFDPFNDCPDGNYLDTVYGGGREAAYKPTDPYRGSPVVNIMNNRYVNSYTEVSPAVGNPGDVDYEPAHIDTGWSWVQIQDVFGGGLGATATSTSYPRVVIGGFGNNTVNRGTDTDPVMTTYERKVQIFGNVYGGGSAAPVVGNTMVMVRDAVIGPDGGDATMKSGIVFGGGLGATAKVDGETYVGIFGLSDIKNNVYGGGNAGIVTGSTEIQIGYQKQIFPPEILAFQVFDDNGQAVIANNEPVIKANLVCTTPGVRFRYTLDGSAPTPTTGILWDGINPVPIEWDQPVQAIAYLWDEANNKLDASMIPSLVAFDKSTSPVITIDGNTANFDGTMGARIYYTRNGDEPTATQSATNFLWGTVFEAPGGAVTLGTNDVVKAIAVQRGSFDSHVSYLTAEKPVITHSSSHSTTFTLTAKPGERIIYTVDGSTPISKMNKNKRPGEDVAGYTVVTESTPYHHTVTANNGTVTHKKATYTDDDNNLVTYRWVEVAAPASGATSVTITVTPPSGDDCTVKAIAERTGHVPSPIAADVYRH